MVGYAPPDPNISNDFQANLAKILNKGQFNEQMKLPPRPKPRFANITVGLPGAPSSGINTGGGNFGPTGNTSLDQLMRAIRGQESGGNYRAYNPSGASGAYQILKSNFVNKGGWDKEALGRDITYQEFMNTPAIQDQIARFKLGQYLKSRGAAGAAATWYGGDWGYKHMYDKRPQAGYPSMYEYVMAILRRAKAG